MTRLTLTGWGRLGLIAAVAAVVVAVVTILWEGAGRSAPLVPWTAPAVLLVAAAFIAVLAYRMKVRVHVRREWVAAESGIRLVALAKAVVHTAALVVGGYLGYALVFVGRWEIPAPRARVIASALAVIGGVLLLGAGRWLERSCRTPGDPDDEEKSPGTPT